MKLVGHARWLVELSIFGFGGNRWLVGMVDVMIRSISERNGSMDNRAKASSFKDCSWNTVGKRAQYYPIWSLTYS